MASSLSLEGAIKRIRRVLRWDRPALPQEILAAIFSAACEAGLTIDEGLRVMQAVAGNLDADLAAEIAAGVARLRYSTDRKRTYQVWAGETSSELLRRLFTSLSAAESSGEETVTRSRQIFETLSSEREAAVLKRAETYPLLMIVLMVLFFIPAIVVLLVGPLYISLMQVLTSF